VADLAPITIEGAPEEATYSPEEVAAPAPEPPKAYTTEPGHLAFVDDRGEVQSVPAENAAEAMQYGYRPATRAEFKAARDGFAGDVMAGITGVGRGLSFGLTDPLTIEADRALEGDRAAEDMRQELSDLKEGHPHASLAGEVGGSLLALMFGAPPAETEAALGEGFLTRAGQRIVRGAPQLVGEGALYGMGQQLSEDALGGHELAAGKYLASGLEGGIFNLLLGSAFHVAGGAALDGAVSGAKSLLSSAAKASEEGGGASLLSRAEGEAERQAFKATGAKIGAIKKLGVTAEEQGMNAEKIGRTLLDEGIVTPMASKPEMASRVDAALEKYGSEIGTLRKGLDRSAIRPEVEPILKRIDDEVVVPLAEKAFTGAELRAVESPILELTDRVKGKEAFDSFEQLQTLRRDLADFIYPKAVKGALPPPPPAGFESLKRVERILEEEYETAAARASKDLGEDFTQRYSFAKARYSDLSKARDILASEGAREIANRAFSLTDTIAAGHGFQTAALGVLSGHPAAALAAIAPLANKAVRTYGNQTAAYVLNRMTKLEAVKRAVHGFDNKLDVAARALFTKETKTLGPARAQRTITPEERRALRQMLANPSAMTEAISDAMARTGLAHAAPKVAAAMSSTLLRAAMYVKSVLPPEPRQIGMSFNGETPPRKLGGHAQFKLDRAIDALDVDRTLDDLGHGKISRQQVEALKFVDPPLFVEIQNRLRSYGQENDPRVNVQKQVALSILFDTPVSAYTQPATRRGFQQAFAQGVPNEPTLPGTEPLKPIGTGHSDAAESLASPTDRTAADGAL
jgi:hypothetical protein